MNFSSKNNLRSGSWFSFCSVKHSGGKGEMKNRAWYTSSTERLPPTFLIDWHLKKQPIKISSACTILCKQISHNGNLQNVKQMLAKIRKSQATIYFLGTSAQIYRIADLRVPLLYMVALSEPKLNENSEHDNVSTKICCMLESFHFWWYILYAFVTDFLRKKSREIKRNTFSFIV